MEIKFSKHDLRKILGYKSLNSVYSILNITFISVRKTYYTQDDLNKLKISKTLLNSGYTKEKVINYWREYRRLKNVQEI